MTVKEAVLEAAKRLLAAIRSVSVQAKFGSGDQGQLGARIRDCVNDSSVTRSLRFLPRVYPIDH